MQHPGTPCSESGIEQVCVSRHCICGQEGLYRTGEASSVDAACAFPYFFEVALA